jgi:hypothetical protein
MSPVRSALQPDLAAQLRAAPVHEGRADVGQSILRLSQPVAPQKQSAESIVHGILGGSPAAEHDRGDPDHVHAMRAVERGHLVG